MFIESPFSHMCLLHAVSPVYDVCFCMIHDLPSARGWWTASLSLLLV